jgi:hypothetical protein
MHRLLRSWLLGRRSLQVQALALSPWIAPLYSTLTQPRWRLYLNLGGRCGRKGHACSCVVCLPVCVTWLWSTVSKLCGKSPSHLLRLCVTRAEGPRR